MLVSPTCVGLPNRDAASNAPPLSGLLRWVHSEDRQARIEGPSEGRVPWPHARSLVRAMGACALWRMPTSFPSSATFGHPLSSARLLATEDTATCGRTDRGPRSDDAPRRAPPSRRPGCLSPSRHAKERGSRRDCSLRPSRRLSRSRRPHFFPKLGRVLLTGHCKVTVRSPAGSVTTREYRRLFYSLELPRLGLTTQARQRARPTQPSTRADCLARTDAGRSA